MSEPLFPPPMPEDLTQAILTRTSGSPCRRLQALACELVDGELAPGPASLARTHLEHCPACRALVAALRELPTILPSFQALEPGPAFTGAVLQATLPPDLPSFKTTWLRLARRPRICLEAAYLGTVAGILTLNAPLPGLRTLADSALVANLGQPLARVTPAFQATRARARLYEQKASVQAAQHSRQVRTFWGQVATTLRGWLARLSSTLFPKK